MITKNTASHTLIIHTVTNFDALQVEHHRDQLRALVDEGYRHLIFDLEATEYINSSGLGMLVELYNSVSRLEGTIRLINCGEQVRWLLTQTHLDRLLIQAEQDDPSAVETPAQRPQPQFDDLHAMMSDEIHLLAHINNLISKTLQLDDPLQIGREILEAMVTTTRSSRGALFFLVQHDERLSLVHWIDRAHPDQRPDLTDYPLKFNKLEYTILSHDDVALHHIPQEPTPTAHLFQKLGFRNLLAAPISGRLRRYGLVCVEIDEETTHLNAARPLIRTMTSLGGLALEKAALLNQVNLGHLDGPATNGRRHGPERALSQAGRLATLGTVTTGLSHQLNNKLAPLMGYLQMLDRQTDLPKDVVNKLMCPASVGS